MNFNAWMQDVDTCIKEQSGLSIRELPDNLFYFYREWFFKYELKPEEAAHRALSYTVQDARRILKMLGEWIDKVDSRN